MNSYRIGSLIVGSKLSPPHPRQLGF